MPPRQQTIYAGPQPFALRDGCRDNMGAHKYGGAWKASTRRVGLDGDTSGGKSSFADT